MFTNCLWKTLDLFCLLLIIPLQQEKTLSTVSCISVTVQGLKSLFAVVYNAAYRKLNLWWWQETVFCCLTYVFCWNWAPVILKVSSVGAPAAVHCETEFGIEFSPQVGHRVDAKPAVERVIFQDLCTPLCIIRWGSLLGFWTQCLELNCLSLSSTEPQGTSSVPGAYLSGKTGLVL